LGISVDLQDHSGDLERSLDADLGKAVRRTAFKIEGAAKQAAPVDTGYLRNSLFTVTDQGSGANAALTRTERRRDITNRKRRKKGQADLLIRLNADLTSLRVGAPTEAYVAVGASYGPFVEFGTASRAAHPFLGPAVDREKADFERGVAAIFERYR
jgi:HK97 gp10 family phage protein